MLTYADYVYIIVRKDIEILDSVYEDYLIKIIGEYGLDALLEAGYLETCGVVRGRQLYTLVER